ncbi:MAG: 16S rRNA (uracil(1498)-N(3))-methyltransferase [Bacteroidota bacterium]|nr:16S rRNA (uracil(1498)-N(3))-methyltransferase [Bacteroidota bacterium]
MRIPHSDRPTSPYSPMQLPFFFELDLPDLSELILSEESSHHIAQVLRMKEGASLLLTDGRGTRAEAVILEAHRRQTRVRISERSAEPRPRPEVRVAIPLIKNKNRLEWFLEKATETGVSEILPLITSRTEKSHFRTDRARHILVSAMLQSEQSWMPAITEPLTLTEVLTKRDAANKYIAHCMDIGQKQFLREVPLVPGDHLVLIGPEGDFTPQEVELAFSHDFQAIGLGDNRLRTETAALVAAVLILQRTGRM